MAPTKYSLKPWSKVITSTLKLFYNQIESYNNERCFNSGVKSFLTIQNNEPIVNSLESLNKRNNGKSVS